MPGNKVCEKDFWVYTDYRNHEAPIGHSDSAELSVQSETREAAQLLTQILISPVHYGEESYELWQVGEYSFAGTDFGDKDHEFTLKRRYLTSLSRVY